MSAFLALEDGTVFRGESVGAEGVAFGEAVFTTAMTGYQETVTDPSFAEQLVCFTAPMVGNYGVAAGRAESPGAHAKAVLMREARGPEWTDWLAGARDRRADRDRHALARPAPARGRRDARRRGRGRDGRGGGARRGPGELPSMEGAALVAQVSTPEPYVYCDAGTLRVAVVDYGCKRSILRRLAGAGAHVTVFPHTVDADELAAYDAVLLSNGPGDPEPLDVRGARSCASCSAACPCSGSASATSCSASRPATRRSSSPSATAAPTIPVLERRSGRVLVTSQNHGFAVAPSRRRRGDARLALRRHGRGLRLPRAAGPLGAVPPRGRPRPARRLADPRALGRGGAGCRVGRTSSRSA